MINQEQQIVKDLLIKAFLQESGDEPADGDAAIIECLSVHLNVDVGHGDTQPLSYRVREALGFWATVMFEAATSL